MDAALLDSIVEGVVHWVSVQMQLGRLWWGRVWWCQGRGGILSRWKGPQHKLYTIHHPTKTYPVLVKATRKPFQLSVCSVVPFSRERWPLSMRRCVGCVGCVGAIPGSLVPERNRNAPKQAPERGIS